MRLQPGLFSKDGARIDRIWLTAFQADMLAWRVQTLDLDEASSE